MSSLFAGRSDAIGWFFPLESFPENKSKSETMLSSPFKCCEARQH